MALIFKLAIKKGKQNYSRSRPTGPDFDNNRFSIAVQEQKKAPHQLSLFSTKAWDLLAYNDLLSLNNR